MTINNLKKAFLLVLPLTLSFYGFGQKVVSKLQSPDKSTTVQFGIDDAGRLHYKMDMNGRVVIAWSAMGLETNGPELANGIKLTGETKTSHRETFDWALGEDARIENNYQQTVLHCQTANAKFDIIARAFNGSFAFRYVTGLPGLVRLQKELTTFNIADDATIYQYHEESIFSPLKLNELTRICDLPATVITDGRLYLSIGEADNRNYTKCVLVKGPKANSLALNFYTDTTYRNKIPTVHRDTMVTFKDSLASPWRTISCTTSAVGLHQFSQLNLKLVTPQNNQNPTHIKPGKVFRVPISTQGGLDGVDFAARMNFQFIMFDAGWYGAEFRTTSDPTKPIPGLDLAGVIAHAKSKGIGVILYVNYVGLKAKLDTILPLFKQWGVSGLKFGFVDGGSQKGLSWLDTAMKKVNDYGFILNVHDHYKPTGLSRRYPYNLSQEGIRGDENSPDAFHTMVLPYTRYLAGPADFTFCYPNPSNAFSKNLKVTKGQQLALTVVYFDPLQAIFWYGKSQDYKDDKDIEFFKYVPTVWDESHFLQGEIGEKISVARRNGDTWYMGNATGFTPWKTEIPLSFLNKHQNYIATVYEDDNKNGIVIRTIKVTSGDKLPVDIAAKSGQAIIIRPVKK